MFEESQSDVFNNNGQPMEPETISLMTRAYNQEVREAENMIHHMEKQKKQNLHYLDRVNCSEMLKKANLEIKVINQILDRLLPSDDKHTVITEERPQEIEVIPDNLMTYRVPCKDMISPCRFFITKLGDTNSLKA